MRISSDIVSIKERINQIEMKSARKQKRINWLEKDNEYFLHF